MFRNGQPDCDDDHIFVVTMTATKEQEKFKDTKGVIRSRKSNKDKQHNGQRSERVMLFKFNSSIIQLYHGDEKVISNNVMMRSALY